MKKNSFIAVFLFLCVNFSSGQENQKGIIWDYSTSSFDQLKEKAKKENKYIFIDCFTTWCGPCKMMDNEVYPLPAVGEFMNARFINVRLQFDKTYKDDFFVKSWYQEVGRFSKQYLIDGYPTFFYFNPSGQLVYKSGAVLKSLDFIADAKKALEPGRKFIDPFESYRNNLAIFEAGRLPFDSLPTMIIVSKKRNDEHFESLERAFIDSLLSLPKERRYTRNRVFAMWKIEPAPHSPIFNLFYKEGDLINKSVSGYRWYSAKAIDESVMKADILPFIMQQAEDLKIKITDPLLKDMREPNWLELQQILKSKYNRYYASREMLLAKIRWFDLTRNKNKSFQHSILYWEKYPPDFSTRNGLFGDCSALNDLCWDIFCQTLPSEKANLKSAEKLLEEVVSHKEAWTDQILDTYANILYKLGKKNEAIEWEEAAIKITAPTKVDSYNKWGLNPMKNGEPTYSNVAKWK